MIILHLGANKEDPSATLGSAPEGVRPQDDVPLEVILNPQRLGAFLAVILSPGGFAQGRRISAPVKKILAHAHRASEEDPSAKKPQDDVPLEVILNPSQALRREVKNLNASDEDPSAKTSQRL